VTFLQLVEGGDFKSQTMNTYVTKDGREFIIRHPTENDAADIIDYSRLLFASTDQLLTTLEEYSITIENEKGWINSFNENPNAKILMAEFNNQIIGLLFFVANPKKKNSHTGEFGVSVHPEFQGINVGRILVEVLLIWARENSKIEKVYLNVFDTNRPAIKLYKDLGFAVEGRHVKAVKQLNGEYVDILQMYIETK
jgi:RimJ/RimL family protein N-acetyltransferase